MSMFGGALMPMGMGYEEDPVFGNATRMMRQMDSMMSSMMQDPFGGDPFRPMFGAPMMGIGGMMGPQMRPQQQQLALPSTNMNALNIMSNPMAMMNSMMSNMDGMRGESASQMFSSSSMMSMTTGPDGRPQVYQSSSSSRGMPGGVRETQHSVLDSTTGVRRMAVGHHIGDRARIVERERRGEDEEEREELLNLDDEETDQFEKEFRHAATGSRRHRHTAIEDHRSAPAPLAIEDRPHPRPAVAAAAPTGAGADRYTVERVPLHRSSGIDVSNFDRRISGGVSTHDRIEYHRPNTTYTPAPTSYTRPSTYAPTASYLSRPYRSSVLGRRPASGSSSYIGRTCSGSRDRDGGDVRGRATHGRTHRRHTPYNQ